MYGLAGFVGVMSNLHKDYVRFVDGMWGLCEVYVWLAWFM